MTTDKLLNYIGVSAMLVTIGSGSCVVYNACTKFDAIYSSTKISVQHQNILGSEKPETYVEMNGVKYFSHIDGKEISDLIK